VISDAMVKSVSNVDVAVGKGNSLIASQSQQKHESKEQS
jgi:hypothetical protein